MKMIMKMSNVSIMYNENIIEENEMKWKWNNEIMKMKIMKKINVENINVKKY